MFSKTILLTAACAGMVAAQAGAATITFDFGTGNNNNNSQTATDGSDDPSVFDGGEPGNWNPVAELDALSTESITLGGLEMTINGVAGSAGSWGANTQGLGIITTSDASGAATRRRIDGTAGEAITFSFDQDVVLNSLALGSFGTGEVATLTPAGGSVITFDDSVAFGPQDLRSLGDVTVTAGTLITLTTTTPTGGGVLFNQITVSEVPEPGSLALLGLGGLMLVRRRR